MAARGSNAKKKSKRRRHAKARTAAEIQAAEHVAPGRRLAGAPLRDGYWQTEKVENWRC